MPVNHQSAFCIAQSLGWNAEEVEFRPISGGSIAGSWRLESANGHAFVKTMPRAQADVLNAERDGLERLAAAGAVATPAVLGFGAGDDTAWLALEYLDMRGPDTKCFERLGGQLAGLHRHRAGQFGLERDNFIGATEQPNTQSDNWTEFFFDHRLGFQFGMLAHRHRGFGPDAADALRRVWESRFPGYRPEPALLHGDLWCGNVAMLDDGGPVVFDPAVHYGDRECDLAMADLFGGFDAAFYDAYCQTWPPEPGRTERRRFYQLYHLLNHANLFGDHYIDACRRLVDELAGSATTAT